METLSKLFGSEAKVKMMRLFLFNPETVFDTAEISRRSDENPVKVRKEINLLLKTGLVKHHTLRSGKNGFVLNSQFTYLLPLQNFLINTEPLQPKEIIHRISKLGVIKLILVAGVFIQNQESRVDILIVGDHIKKSALEHTMKSLESEIGKELRYSHFTTEDFNYRNGMCDKLIRDILDYPHKKLVNKLGII
jgi:hypothetical protein